MFTSTWIIAGSYKNIVQLLALEIEGFYCLSTIVQLNAPARKQ